MTGTIVTLGELMARLKPPGKLRLRQTNVFEVCHGGAEANVAVSLANFGLNVRFVSALPQNELGEQIAVARVTFSSNEIGQNLKTQNFEIANADYIVLA